MQREAPGRIDVHAIALQPARRRLVALIDRDADAGFLQALREREAANAAADDDDMERRNRRVERAGAIGRRHRMIPA